MDSLHKNLSIKDITGKKFENGEYFYEICWHNSWISEDLLKLSFPKSIFLMQKWKCEKDLLQIEENTSEAHGDISGCDPFSFINADTCNLNEANNVSPKSSTLTLHSNHVQKVNANTRHACDLCSVSFTSREQLVTHTEQCGRHNSSQYPLRNGYSHDEKILTVNDIKTECVNVEENTRVATEQEVLSVSCEDTSNASYKAKFGRTYRKKCVVEPSKTLVYECLNCKMTFANVDYLTRHLVRCKNHDDLSYKCTTCERGFTTKGSLDLHVNTIHLKKKDFGCSLCGKLFSKKHILKIHLDTHYDKRNYGCTTCGKTFIQKSNLTRHERIHQETNYGYICKYCGQVYSQNQYLQNHLVSHSEFKNN